MPQADNPKWGMVIDLDRCTGCSACVTACSLENNVPIVGEADAGYGRGMHWIRIERYWEGTYPNLTARFRPIMCQQCGNAPCEPVCPVYASYHSQAEQLNVQVYNRCVGTRYCGNNCPYIARQFNWFGYADIMPEPLNSQFNPDVTVRSRGVMEKCTFCLQRIRRGEETAKALGRPVLDGEVEPACAQACPSDAIYFGLLSVTESSVSQLSRSPRAEVMLEDLGTSPRVIYLKAGSGAIRKEQP
jgi:molybdopterin-containing oxidoreductase family iron-sulfur binding subunit